MVNFKRYLAPAAMMMAAMGASGQAMSACDIGPGSGEIPLQQVMNGLFGSAAPAATLDCVADGSDAAWVATGPAAATLIVEIAGNANRNTFGIYDLGNTGNFLEIYAGENSSFDRRTLTFTANGGAYDVAVWRNGGVDLVSSGIFTSDQFGFYISTPEIQTYYSDTSLNADGFDHLQAYQGNGAQFLSTPSVPDFLRGTTFHDQMYLLAWEDLFGGGDGDYQDMVLLTEFMAPVPVPPAFFLLASALAALGWTSRRKTQSPEAITA